MISMTYAHRFEADRFAMRNDSGLRRNDSNDLGAAVRNHSFRYGANPFAFLLLRLVGMRCAAAARFPLALLHRVQIAAGQEVGSGKKLRKRAGKSLKRLSRVSLCAGPSDLPAGAELAPATHQPKAVIECNSAPSSQAFVVAESGQTTVELWRRVFNDHAFPCATLASDRPVPPVVPSAGKGLIAWHNTLRNIVELL
jgi:hypothetical protein